MNALVTALLGLVPIFVLAGGVNALAGVLLLFKMIKTESVSGVGNGYLQVLLLLYNLKSYISFYSTKLVRFVICNKN